MSKEVKRYTMYAGDGPGVYEEIEPDGEWVSWSDYKTLLEENKLLKATQYGSGRMQELRDERDQLRAEVETLRKVIRAALYYVPEHKHDLREIMSAIMAAKGV